MGLQLDVLSSDMEKVFKSIIVKERLLSLGNLKQDLLSKKQLLNRFANDMGSLEVGKIPRKLISEVNQLETYFKTLHEDFEDKLMIFIIGNGNVGKSTLLNSLIGYEVAETNFLPNTWKIDVYTPELDREKAIIKYENGRHDVLALSSVKEIIAGEEKKSKDSKGCYNEKLNVELKKLKTKEEREEMKKHLSEKYLYKSLVSEVRWPVESNWMLEECLFVDTPGLNQNLHDSNQLGNIHDYYHKADGVLWLLDGQAIAAVNTADLYNELDTVLKTVGGVRANIIGVVNRMDLVRNNGGEEAVEKVLQDAKRIFGDKFSHIVGISAHQACEGVLKERKDLLENSGILNLRETIKDIFISQQELVKNSAKIQGHNKLVDLTRSKLEDCTASIDEYEAKFISKEEFLIKSKEKLKSDMETAIEAFFENYLEEVKERVDLHIMALAEGENADYIRNTMYRLDEFDVNKFNFIKNKQLEIKNNAFTWEKTCRVSEYKYINETLGNENALVPIESGFDLRNLDSITYFKPAVEDTVFSFLSNAFGKVKFMLQKNGIKKKINDTIRSQCEEAKQDTINNIHMTIEMRACVCRDILEKSFKEVLCEFTQIDQMRKEIQQLERELCRERAKIDLIQMVL